MSKTSKEVLIDITVKVEIAILRAQQTHDCSVRLLADLRHNMYLANSVHSVNYLSFACVLLCFNCYMIGITGKIKGSLCKINT